MIPRILQQRSSWPSSFITGLIAWNALTLIVTLAFGYSGSLNELFAWASLNAFLQVLVLRLFFFLLRMQKSLWLGVAWGAVSAGLLIGVERNLIPIVQNYFLISLLTAVYIGGPVGAFLSYFYRDDQRIGENFSDKNNVNYGRDAHWLDPFIYGALSYLIVFFPHSLELVIFSMIVGSFVGVVAAGVSHFFLSIWKNAVWTIPVATIGGIFLGAVSGFLFRNYQSQIYMSFIKVGAMSGALTFTITSLMGRYFALKEKRP